MTPVPRSDRVRTPALRVRVVVADQSAARFYDVSGRGARLTSAGELANPKARVHDRELRSDKPGRIFSSAAGATSPRGTGRRGSVVHHAAGGERGPQRQEAQRFARRIAADLLTAHRADRFERLVLMAGPRFLGDLRAALPASLRRQVSHEVRGDFVHQPESEVRGHIPSAALFPPLGAPPRRGRT